MSRPDRRKINRLKKALDSLDSILGLESKGPKVTFGEAEILSEQQASPFGEVEMLGAGPMELEPMVLDVTAAPMELEPMVIDQSQFESYSSEDEPEIYQFLVNSLEEAEDPFEGMYEAADQRESNLLWPASGTPEELEELRRRRAAKSGPFPPSGPAIPVAGEIPPGFDQRMLQDYYSKQLK